jgi:hypothetical protein
MDFNRYSDNLAAFTFILTSLTGIINLYIYICIYTYAKHPA